jgi:hypothetical protein
MPDPVGSRRILPVAVAPAVGLTATETAQACS